jgi:hypothetical protein
VSHENSITVERDGRFYVLDNSGSDKGKVLGPKRGFSSLSEANDYAKKRSREYGKRYREGKPSDGRHIGSVLK